MKQAPGKEPIVSGESLERLKQKLEEPQGFNSYNQIQQWLKNELRLNIAYKTVYQRTSLFSKEPNSKFLVPKVGNSIQRAYLTLKKLPRFAQIFTFRNLGQASGLGICAKTKPAVSKR